MPKSTESLNNSLFDLLRSKGYDPTILDTSGKEIPVPDEAEVFQFNFVKDSVDYGKVTISIDGLQKLTIYYNDDVANSSRGNAENSQDSDWYSLLKQLKKFAKKRQLGFVLKNSSHLKHDMAKRDYMKQKEKISEGYYPMGKKTSYSDAVPTVKIVIEHTRQLEEGEARFRSINRIFLENQLGEKYLLETKKPGIARVYARHIAEGGKVNDKRWEHISNLSEEYNKMSGFVRAVRNNQFNESAQVLVNEGIQHYQKLRETLSRMSGHRGYNMYFESWTPALMEDEIEGNNLNELFVQETLDPRIESVMPILSKLHKKVSEMKEINQLEEWADNIIENADDIDSLERSSSSGQDSKKTTPSKPVIGTIKGGVWTADPPKKGEKGVPVPTPVDEEYDKLDEVTMDEGLDANQKRVGQLGPTEKVKNNNIGKLVGANESVEQGVAEGSESTADIDKKIEFHKQGQAAAQYKGAMNKMHAAKIRELEAKKKALKQGVAEGVLGDREYNRVMPFVKRIASEVSDYDRDEFGEELWSLLDQKYGSKFAQSVLQDSLDFYWDTYTELTGQQGVAEGSLNEVTQGVEHSEWADNVKDAYHPAQVRIVKKRTEDGRHVKSVAMIGDRLVGQYTMNTGVGTFTAPKKQGVAEAFGPLPKDNQQIQLGRFTVELERVGMNKNYIGFSWHDSKGQEHYEEVAVGDLGSYDDLIAKIKDEIRGVENRHTKSARLRDEISVVAEGSFGQNVRQYPQGSIVSDHVGNQYKVLGHNGRALSLKGTVDGKRVSLFPHQLKQGVAEGLNEMDKSQPSSDRGGESSGDPYAKGGKATSVKSKDVAKHALKTLDKAMDKSHPKTWHDVDKKLGKAVDKMSQDEKVKKGFAHPNTLKKKVKEGQEDLDAILRIIRK